MTGPVWAKPDNLGDVFAQRLRVAMAARDMRGVDIADHLRISKSSVSTWMNGEKYPGTSHLVGISRFLKVSIDWLMDPEPLDTEIMFAPDAGRGVVFHDARAA